MIFCTYKCLSTEVLEARPFYFYLNSFDLMIKKIIMCSNLILNIKSKCQIYSKKCSIY